MKLRWNVSDILSSQLPYKVFCIEPAYDEWCNLDAKIKLQFQTKLKELVKNPCVPSKQLHKPLNGFYKIVFMRAGYRLVYEVINDKIILLVWTVGKRKDSEVYKTAINRTKNTIYEDEDLLEINIE